MRIAKKEKKTKNRPEVCLSLNCSSFEELKSEIYMYKDYCQVVEWQVDKTSGSKYYTKEEFLEKLKEIKRICRRKKLIVDYKGDEEVGNRIQRWAMGHADIIDLDADNSEIEKMVKEARRKRTKTIISHHDFEGMPDKNEIAAQFVKMEKTGGDMLKIACFAEKELDTYNILEAASAYTQLRDHKPIIAIAMGEEGQVSSICAGDFGSIISYSCGSNPVAAGQFNARDLDKYLNTYYKGR